MNLGALGDLVGLQFPQQFCAPNDESLLNTFTDGFNTRGKK